MKKIIWTNDFSVGIPSLDRQHKQIVEIINELLSSPNLRASSPEVGQALCQLNRYSREHFQLEERLLKAHGYPGLPEQEEGHLEYMQKIIVLHKKALHYENEVPVELLTFLARWWEDHILYDDMKYKGFLNEG